MQIEQKQNRIYRPQGVYTLSAEESNQITTELENLISDGGLTPNANVLTQVKDSVNNIVDAAANNLQTQIDAITSASNVFDIVGTYAQLQAYDTSEVSVDDIIKVLQDSTHQNAASYYRWSGSAWIYVGQEGPYYMKSEIDADFALKTQLPGVATTAQAGLVKPDGQSIIAAPDGTISAASTILASLPLFTWQFSDHIIGNPSYLRADTFSWQSGSVYTSGYQHLVSDIAGKTAETETISGTTITFYRADDGHKIVLAAQESNVALIYAATGVAWYYILDTANTRFKLPRSSHGNIVQKGQSGTEWYRVWSDGWCEQGGYSAVIPGSGALSITFQIPMANTNYSVFGGTFVSTTSAAGDGRFRCGNLTTTSMDIDWTNPGYEDRVFWEVKGYSASSAENSQYKYLYFYAGNTVQDQTTIDVGEITEALNGKADLNLANVPSSKGILVESYVNGTSWYRVYSDGWCEQGGQTVNLAGSDPAITTFLKQFANTNYCIQICPVGAYTAMAEANNVVSNKAANQFQLTSGQYVTQPFSWYAAGYIS